MGIAARIRALRVRAGKSQAHVAGSLGLNSAWYADLETRDDELAATLTMFKAMELASLLDVSLHDLFDAPAAGNAHLPLIDLPDRITAHAKRARMSIEQLEEKTGWDLREFLASPVQAAAELPILFFQAVATELGMNWLILVPDEP